MFELEELGGKEIAAEARKSAPAAEILLYTDLLSRAHARPAA